MSDETGNRPPRPSVADRRLWQFAAVRDVVLIAIVLFLVWFGYYLRSIFTPLLIALTLAYLFDPLITYAERRAKMPRPLTIVLLIVVLVLAVAGLGAYMYTPLKTQTVTFANDLEAWAQDLTQREDLPAWVKELDLEKRLKDIQKNPSGVALPVLRAVLSGSGHVADALGGLFGTVTSLAMSAALIPIYFFFFAWQFSPMTRSLEQYLPASSRQRILEVVQRMDAAVAAFVRGRIIIAGIMGAMFAVGFLICGVPYWLLLGLLGGLLSLIPFVGGVVWPIAMLLGYLNAPTIDGAMEEGWYWSVLVGPTIVFAIVQFVEGWILTPWIGGKSVNLDTVTMIVVVFIGGAVGGMYGLLLCVPVAACIRILMIDVILPRLRQWSAEN